MLYNADSCEPNIVGDANFILVAWFCLFLTGRPSVAAAFAVHGALAEQ